MADTDARPVGQDELVADIDRTRAQLARTIDCLLYTSPSPRD